MCPAMALGYHGSMVKRKDKKTEGRVKMNTNVYEQGRTHETM